jgi:hypothetical protein
MTTLPRKCAIVSDEWQGRPGTTGNQEADMERTDRREREVPDDR